MSKFSTLSNKIDKKQGISSKRADAIVASMRRFFNFLKLIEEYKLKCMEQSGWGKF